MSFNGPQGERLRQQWPDTPHHRDMLHREAADRIEADAATIAAERSSRGMFVARLENMQANGDQWLTVAAVLALLNDCDMLAASERA